VASADKLTIETPEQTSLEYSLAGVGSRFLALAFDSLLQLIASLVLFITAMLLIGGTAELMGLNTWILAGLTLFYFCLYYGYYAFFESIWDGQTPGKRYAGLRVIKDSGRPITPYEAIGRNLLRIVDQFPGIYAVGIAAALISSQNKRLGDLVAGTVVVHEQAFASIQPAWEVGKKSAAAESAAPGGRRYAAERLTAEEFQLIEAFLLRRSSLTDDVRRQTAYQIAARMGHSLAVSPEERPDAESFLEALARERRSVARYI